ncbi:MAG: hypothetical protein JSV11_00075 [Nitrospiraceae bacterium]|nr:MAG: hypothetical protein JSU99_04200 [Nitrospiraceae bacterium]UCH45140.1 MAG: hypothetical protein JSV11_00075 [Nitrospiraceae bacterium]
MGYTNVALKDKIFEMYPEIGEKRINVGLEFSDEKESYVIKFKKDLHELTTYLEKKDADECMDGVKCVHLGVQIGEFLKNFDG